MLVLTRKPSQTIEIPELEITFKVIQAGRGSVKIGVSAPTQYRIIRGEILASPADHVAAGSQDGVDARIAPVTT